MPFGFLQFYFVIFFFSGFWIFPLSLSSLSRFFVCLLSASILCLFSFLFVCFPLAFSLSLSFIVCVISVFIDWLLMMKKRLGDMVFISVMLILEYYRMMLVIFDSSSFLECKGNYIVFCISGLSIFDVWVLNIDSLLLICCCCCFFF